jgi:hypothetical protein
MHISYITKFPEFEYFTPTYNTDFQYIYVEMKPFDEEYR